MDYKINERIMPRDVKTRWNSTYDMLKFALDYQRVINAITSDRENNLRAYELSPLEWETMRQLSEVLKVRHQIIRMAVQAS